VASTAAKLVRHRVLGNSAGYLEEFTQIVEHFTLSTAGKGNAGSDDCHADQA
jgi:hypothetical protein